MKEHRVLLILLILAAVALDTVLLDSMARGEMDVERQSMRIASALASSQIAVLVAWLVLAPGKLAPAKLLAAVGGAWMVHAMLMRPERLVSPDLVVHVSLLLAGLLAVRILGGRQWCLVSLKQPAAISTPPTGAASMRHRQFALGDMMLLTACVAVSLGAARDIGTRELLRVLPMQTANVIATWVILLFLLRPGYKVWQGIAVVLALLALAFALRSSFLMFHLAGDMRWLLHVGLLSLMTLVLRVAGVRITRATHSLFYAEQPSAADSVSSVVAN